MLRQSNKLPYTAAAVAAIIFGFSFLFTKGALDYLNTFELLGFRFILAALFLTILKLLGFIKININFSNVKELLVVALLQPVAYFFFETIGVGLTSASESSIVISLVPISITICAVFILKERLNLLQWASVGISVIGVVLIVISKGAQNDKGHFLGIAALIGAVIAAGFYNVLSRKVSVKFTPVEITFMMMWVGAVVFNIAGMYVSLGNKGILGYFASFINSKAIISVAYLGILSSVAAFFLLNYSLSRLEASKSAVFMNLTPVISVLDGIIFRGENFYLLQCLGTLLIFAGIWGANRSSLNLRKGNTISLEGGTANNI